MGDLHRAEILELETAIARGDDRPEVFFALGGAKLGAGDLEGAVAAYQGCLARSAPEAGLCNNLGTALLKLGRFDEAIAALTKALELRPGYVRALVNLGKALREIGRMDDAIVHLRQALMLEPDYAPALINLGDVEAARGDLVAAEGLLERATLLAPARPEAWTALGIVRWQAGRPTQALQALWTAVSLAPQQADAHMNLAAALYGTGHWKAAWTHFEYRLRRKAPPSPMTGPRWDGVGGAGEIWLIGEQGLGDQLQFARYGKLLANQGIPCVLACHPSLVQLLTLAHLGPRVVALPVPTEDSCAPWLPLMSLPLWHRTRPDTVPFAEGYLTAEPDRVARWRSRLPRDRRRQVALSWAGNPRTETGRYIGRSPPLETLAPLLQVPGIEWISLQKGVGAEQLDCVPFGPSIRRFPDLDAGPQAFLDTAALLAGIDLLVTSDTAILHLAGALGVPTWLCLMHDPDWRWQSGGSTTPWYRSVRIFRQSAPGAWAGVFDLVARELALWVGDATGASREGRRPEPIIPAPSK
jgi:tetratricopeptide (TPR) repeat protein